jgi:prepilin peptidase CpaA
MGLMGAGDVKLMAGVGAWLGWPGVVLVFVMTSFVAGIYALTLIVYRGKIRESWLTMKLIFYRLAVLGSQFGKEDCVEVLSTGKDHRTRVIPYGAMVPLGIVAGWIWTLLQ